MSWKSGGLGLRILLTWALQDCGSSSGSQRPTGHDWTGNFCIDLGNTGCYQSIFEMYENL